MAKNLLFTTILFILFFTACKKDKPAPAVIHLNSVSFTADSTTVIIGNKAQLAIQLNPTSAVDTQMVYTSADTTIAAVGRYGLVSAKKIGHTIITVTNTQKTVSAKCIINVSPVVVTQLSVDSTSLTIEQGFNDTLHAIIAPANASYKTITWTSSNTAIATVNSSGIITAVATGTATITATSVNGKTATCKVQVKSLAQLISANNAYGYGDLPHDEDVYLTFVNNSKHDINISTIQIFDTVSSPTIPFQTMNYRDPELVIHPGQHYYTTLATGNLIYLEGADKGVVTFPVNIFFDSNGKKYEIKMGIVVNSFLQL